MQIRVLLSDIIPNVRSIFHHLNDIGPFLLVLLTQNSSPEVGIFMQRPVGTRNIQINIECSRATVNKAVCLLITGTEETDILFTAIIYNLLANSAIGFIQNPLAVHNIIIHLNTSPTQTLNHSVTEVVGIGDIQGTDIVNEPAHTTLIIKQHHGTTSTFKCLAVMDSSDLLNKIVSKAKTMMIVHDEGVTFMIYLIGLNGNILHDSRTLCIDTTQSLSKDILGNTRLTGKFSNTFMVLP